MIVLDINALTLIFDSKNINHMEFRPVLYWVLNNKRACFIFGGTKYRNELMKMTRYHKIMNEFKKTGKCIEINAQKIDVNAKQLKKICKDDVFDDEHIIAILNISRCKLVCTKDIKSIPYIKRKEFYSDHKIPKIYSSSKNKYLLNKKNLVELKNKC